MAQAALRPPHTLQPRPKAVATFSSNSMTAKPNPPTPPVSTPSVQSRQTSPNRSPTYGDVSNKATIALVRRVLCPNSLATDRRPVEELLPPLTSSNEMDLQLYAIIAIVVKDLVSSWYGKITPDQTFVEEVVKIVAHCTRALESRLRTVDHESLILDEIPAVIERHVQVYRITHDQSTQAGVLSTSPRIIYHDLNPHPALFPVPPPHRSATDEQSENESNYRQLLVQGALAVLLPTEDLENACLRTLVADVIAEVILGDAIGGKACQPTFIWSTLANLIKIAQAKVQPRTTGEAIKTETRGRLEEFGLLTPREAREGKGQKHKQSGKQSGISSLFWRILQYVYLSVIAIRFVIAGFFAASSQPLRSSTLPRRPTSLETSPIETHGVPVLQKPRPILRFRLLTLVSSLLNLPMRSPWLFGGLALLQHHLVDGILHVAATDGILDQYIHCMLKTHLPPGELLPPALRLLRQSLFPNASLPTSTAGPAPSASQTLEIKRRCAIALLEFLPGTVRRHWFTDETPSTTAPTPGPVPRSNNSSTEDSVDSHLSISQAAIAKVESDLDVWSDAYLNKHVAYAVLELVLVRALPELADEPVSDLIRGRLGDDLVATATPVAVPDASPVTAASAAPVVAATGSAPVAAAAAAAGGGGSGGVNGI